MVFVVNSVLLAVIIVFFVFAFVFVAKNLFFNKLSNLKEDQDILDGDYYHNMSLNIAYLYFIAVFVLFNTTVTFVIAFIGFLLFSYSQTHL